MSVAPDPASLPRQPAFETGWATHAGRRRHNEDDFLVQPESGIWAVADGMGGHEAGSLASSTVVEALQSIGHPVSAPDLLARLEDRVLRANARLKDIARQRGNGVIVGSTIAALLIFGSYYACIWSGDSRLYLVRRGRIAQLTRDHTEAQELVDGGLLTADEARTWPRRNIVTRALGVHEEPVLDIDHGELDPDDVFVICSDGLTTHVEEGEILARTLRDAPQRACDALVALALERGGTDNVTVIVIRCRPGQVYAPTDRAGLGLPDLA